VLVRPCEEPETEHEHRWAETVTRIAA